MRDRLAWLLILVALVGVSTIAFWAIGTYTSPASQIERTERRAAKEQAELDREVERVLQQARGNP